jgi:5-methylcytosine-specific restriction enzyme A
MASRWSRPDKTPAERGYTNRWAVASRMFRRENPLCCECLKYGVTKPSECVDHVVPHKCDPVLFWDRNNWQALCNRCHNRKSAKE